MKFYKMFIINDMFYVGQVKRKYPGTTSVEIRRYMGRFMNNFNRPRKMNVGEKLSRRIPTSCRPGGSNEWCVFVFENVLNVVVDIKSLNKEC